MQDINHPTTNDAGTSPPAPPRLPKGRGRKTNNNAKGDLLGSWAAVVTPTVVYVGIEDRGEFDRIALPATEHAPRESGGGCISKCAADEKTGVMVIFQHWTKGE